MKKSIFILLLSQMTMISFCAAPQRWSAQESLNKGLETGSTGMIHNAVVHGGARVDQHTLYRLTTLFIERNAKKDYVLPRDVKELWQTRVLLTEAEALQFAQKLLIEWKQASASGNPQLLAQWCEKTSREDKRAIPFLHILMQP
ncbi:MAG TPA: hypothetical protein VGT41_01215 [Candidatus Babeliales bacterium]|nr:hypothetical protein [Candidatus Babeliales bacterium]